MLKIRGTFLYVVYVLIFMVSCNLSIQDGPQGRVNQDTRLDNRIIDLRVSHVMVD